MKWDQISQNNFICTHELSRETCFAKLKYEIAPVHNYPAINKKGTFQDKDVTLATDEFPS